MRFFYDLGSRIEERWRSRSYDEHAFPGIAAAALEEARAPERVDLDEVFRWLHGEAQLPQQPDPEGMFSDLPITLFHGPRFHIDLYVWLESTTAVHQHAFSGAFQVFRGSSLHSRYRFANAVEVNPHFLRGRLELEGVDLLREGDVRPIQAGRDLIHALFHLDHPSLSLTVRTPSTPTALPQYNYLKPYLALNPFFREPAMLRTVQSVSVMLRMDHPTADERIREILARSDFQTAFFVLQTIYDHFARPDLQSMLGLASTGPRFEGLLQQARERHGELIDLVVPVLEEVRRDNDLSQRRREITEPEHRFFLALLLNVPNRDAILDLVRRRCPDRNPVETVVGWVEELANTRVLGSREPNVLGTECDEAALLVLRCVLEGCPPEQLRRRYAEELEPGPELDAELEGVRAALNASRVLRPLLLEASQA